MIPSFRIIQASEEHKDAILMLLDEFREACYQQFYPEDTSFTSNTARSSGGSFLEKTLSSDQSLILLVEDGGEYAGILTAHAFPLLRFGTYGVTVEEMYVRASHQGSGAAQRLMEGAVSWARMIGANSLNLEAATPLARAHSFYKRFGLKHYGKAFQLKLQEQIG